MNKNRKCNKGTQTIERILTPSPNLIRATNNISPVVLGEAFLHTMSMPTENVKGLPSQNTIVIEDPVEKEGGAVKVEITVMEGTKVVAKAHIDIADAKDAIVEAEMIAET